MKRFAIAILVIGVLTGCAGVSPTPAPTSTLIPSAGPSASAAPVPSAASAATSAPAVAPPTATPGSSESFPGISSFTPYTSAAYGITLGYPDGWSLGAAATRKWQEGDLGWAEGTTDWFSNPSSRDGDEIVFGVWQQPAGNGADITSHEGLAAWFEANLCDDEIDACERVLETAELMCVSADACLPAIVVPRSDGTTAVFADAEAGLVNVVSLGREDSFPATTRYGGGVQLLKSILTTMDVWTPEPGQMPVQ